jgi:hypothetical protein
MELIPPMQKQFKLCTLFCSRKLKRVKTFTDYSNHIVTLSHYKLVPWSYNVDKGVIAHKTINLQYNLKTYLILWHKSYCFDLELNRVKYNLGTPL